MFEVGGTRLLGHETVIYSVVDGDDASMCRSHTSSFCNRGRHGAS